MNRNFSSRSMEEKCKRDINFMYLLEGCPAPDYATFARFRTLHFVPLRPEAPGGDDRVPLSDRRDFGRGGFYRWDKDRGLCRQIHFCLEEVCQQEHGVPGRGRRIPVQKWEAADRQRRQETEKQKRIRTGNNGLQLWGVRWMPI